MKKAVITFLISFVLSVGLFTHFSGSSCAGGHHDTKDCTPVVPIPITESLLPTAIPTISCTPTPVVIDTVVPQATGTPTPIIQIGSPASANSDTAGGNATVAAPTQAPKTGRSQ